MVFSKRILDGSQLVWHVRTKLQARFPGKTPKSFLQSWTGAALLLLLPPHGGMWKVPWPPPPASSRVCATGLSLLLPHHWMPQPPLPSRSKWILNGPTFKIHKLELFPWEFKFLRSCLDPVVRKPTHKHGNESNTIKMVKKYYIGKINETHNLVLFSAVALKVWWISPNTEKFSKTQHADSGISQKVHY